MINIDRDLDGGGDDRMDEPSIEENNLGRRGAKESKNSFGWRRKEDHAKRDQAEK